MYRYKRLLVGLELSKVDPYTIRYAAKVTRMAKSEKVYFVHVAKSLDIPSEIVQKFPDILEPLDEAAKEEIEQRVREHFVNGYPDVKLDYEVIEGNPLPELLRRTRQKLIDLVIVGKKREVSHGGASLPEKIARKAPCSVMIVPEKSKTIITKIVTPVDFSDYSVDAMDVAIAFASTASQKPPIYCLRVYDVPRGYNYYNTPKSFKAFLKAMENYAEKSYNKFIANFDLKNVPVHPIFESSDYVSKSIAKVVKRRKADLLVLGVRGKSSTAAVLLGGTTEKLIRTTGIPLVVVKRKGEHLNLLEALFPK